MPNTHTTLNSLFTDIANAIRNKSGQSGTIIADNFPTAINNLPVAEEYDGTVELPVNYLLLGGKVFLDNGANGATYKFYDADKNKIIYTDIDSLDNAVYYSVEGTPTKDRFYVVASDSSKSDYNSSCGVNLGTEKLWGYFSITTSATTNSIGSGKTNTAKVLAITDTSGSYQYSIWQWLNDVNSNQYGGYSDWFIGSQAEYDALRTTRKAGPLFGSERLWSSVEYDSNYAYNWNLFNSQWVGELKFNPSSIVAFRAF